MIGEEDRGWIENEISQEGTFLISESSDTWQPVILITHYFTTDYFFNISTIINVPRGDSFRVYHGWFTMSSYQILKRIMTE